MSTTRDPSAPSAGAGLLPDYLRDHYAGATAGLELSERAARARAGRPSGRQLSRLTEEIREDRETYRAVMDALGVDASRLKIALAWVGEKVTRLKANGRLVRRSPLSDLVELEALYLGVVGKEAGWRTLRIHAEQDPRLDVTRLDQLIARAREQAALLESLRRDEAQRLFAPPEGGV